MNEAALAKRVEAIRGFNRFYTKRIGVLSRGLLHSPYSLTEARILYELAQRPEATAADIGKDLELDAGYLSRTVQGLVNAGLIEKRRSDKDGRQSLLRLTEAGKEVFAMLDQRSHQKFHDVLRDMPEPDQERLIACLNTVEGLLNGGSKPSEPYLLRPHQPGDMGWVIHSHGAFYAQAFGWDDTFEALVAKIAADFLNNFNPKRERCWIAERDGTNIGSVFLVRQSDTVAKLRLLFVDPSTRGLGIGARLVRECENFARRVGYRTITLWTNSILHSARQIYEAAGYEMVDEEPHNSFGRDLVGQTWQLDLTKRSGR